MRLVRFFVQQKKQLGQAQDHQEAPEERAQSQRGELPEMRQAV